MRGDERVNMRHHSPYMSFSPQSVSPPAELLAGAGGSSGHHGEEVGGKLSGDQEVSLRHQVVHSSPTLGPRRRQSSANISLIFTRALSWDLSSLSHRYLEASVTVSEAGRPSCSTSLLLLLVPLSVGLRRLERIII